MRFRFLDFSGYLRELLLSEDSHTLVEFGQRSQVVIKP